MAYAKKSQVKIQEMIFMLIGLTVFLGIVFLFFLSISLSGLKTSAQASSREGAIMLISRLASSPELECAQNEVSLCVDADKVMALMNRQEYRRFWKVASLKIEKTFPPSNRTIQCSMTNYPNCNTFTIIRNLTSNIIEDASYVSLCRIEYQAGYPYTLCDMGKIIVGTEVVQ